MSLHKHHSVLLRSSFCSISFPFSFTQCLTLSLFLTMKHPVWTPDGLPVTLWWVCEARPGTAALTRVHHSLPQFLSWPKNSEAAVRNIYSPPLPFKIMCSFIPHWPVFSIDIHIYCWPSRTLLTNKIKSYRIQCPKHQTTKIPRDYFYLIGKTKAWKEQSIGTQREVTLCSEWTATTSHWLARLVCVCPTQVVPLF